MKTSTRYFSVAGAVVAAAVVTVTAVQLNGQKPSSVAGDFRNAATAEVRDANGQVMLTGTFAPVDGSDAGEVDRLAKLTSSVAGSTASGEAEVEYETANPSAQEVELTATGITAGAQVTLVIDGTTVATATADNNGKVEVEIDVKSAAAP